jgi:hypothetical protein
MAPLSAAEPIAPWPARPALIGSVLARESAPAMTSGIYRKFNKNQLFRSKTIYPDSTSSGEKHSKVLQAGERVLKYPTWGCP